MNVKSKRLFIIKNLISVSIAIIKNTEIRINKMLAVKDGEKRIVITLKNII
jgi:hypothetical protein